MAAVVVSRTATAVLTLDEMKAQCRIELDFTDDDMLLHQMEKSAVRACEGMIGGPLLTAVWREVLPRWPLVPWLHLEASGAQAVDSVELVQGGQVVLWDGFRAIPDGRQLRLAAVGAWPQVDSVPDAITVTYRAGFGDDAAAVPEDIRQWLLFRVATLYEYRTQFVNGTLEQLVRGFVDSLLDPYILNQAVI